MFWDELLSRAFRFAHRHHEGQIDDDWNDYFSSHCVWVADIVAKVTNDNEVIAAALLHDVIEDTFCTEEELRKEFGDRVADLVLECTHEGQKDTTGYYFPRLKSRDAILIKFADRLQNLSRMDSWDEKRKQQYLNKSKFWKSNPNE